MIEAIANVAASHIAPERWLVSEDSTRKISALTDRVQQDYSLGKLGHCPATSLRPTPITGFTVAVEISCVF